MPLYAWKGLNASGKNVAGTRDADGPKVLRLVLRKESVFLTELREVRGGAVAKQALSGSGAGSGLKREIDFNALFERVRPQDVSMLTRQLATLLRAGIPLAEALAALSEQSDNKKLQMIVAGIRQRVNEGGALADALAVHPKHFTDLYINMVRSGEAAGNLDIVLERLADFLDSQNALKRKVSGALTYPILMMVVGAGVMSVLMIVVVPQITAIFEDSQKALPWNTQILVAASHVIGGYWWIVLPVLVGSYFMLRRWIKTPKGRDKFDRLTLKLPLIGPLVRHVAVARFSRTLATMLASGVAVLTAMEITKRVLNNVILERVVVQARDAIREGESIAVTLRKSKEFPSMMCHMVAVGERSGQLESMLLNVADAYERETDAKVQRLTTLLAPIMILVMAVAVGFIVFSVITPIMDMQQFVQ